MQDEFESQFKYLLIMEISEWIISLFDIEVESVNLDTFSEEEFIEMTFNLEGKYIYGFIVSV